MCTDCDQLERDIHPALGRSIDSLWYSNTAVFKTDNLLPGSCISDGVNKELNRILFRFIVDDLECRPNSPVCQLFFAVVRCLSHDPIDQPLNDRDVRFIELLVSVFAAGM